jgi:hypothetical protein
LSLGMLEELGSKNDPVLQREMRDNMTRFYYILVMQIRRYLDEGKFTEESQVPLIRAMDFRMVAEKIQRIGEIAGYFGQVNPKSKDFLLEIKEFYEKTTLSFINDNYEKAQEHWENGESLEIKYKALLEKSKKSDNKFYKNLLDLFQILRYSREISGLLR